MIAADDEGADDTAGHENTGAAEHLDIAQVAGQGQAGGSNSEAEAKHDLQRLQRRLDSVQEVYKGRNPLVWFSGVVHVLPPGNPYLRGVTWLKPFCRSLPMSNLCLGDVAYTCSM